MQQLLIQLLCYYHFIYLKLRLVSKTCWCRFLSLHGHWEQWMLYFIGWRCGATGNLSHGGSYGLGVGVYCWCKHLIHGLESQVNF